MRRRCLDCRRLIPSGSRCRACQRRYRPGVARSTLPRLAKARDGYRCRICGHPGSPDNPLVVHHLVPLALGGSNALDNLMTLCQRHHRELHHG